MDDLFYALDDYAKLCRSEHTHVRRWAFNRISLQYPHRAGEALAPLVNDGDEDLAVSVLLFLQEEHPPGAEAELIEVVSGERPRLAREAMDALGELRGEAAVPALAAVLENTDEDELLIGAANALTKIGGEGQEIVLRVLGQETPATFEHEVAFDALTHAPCLTHLPRLVAEHIRACEAEEGRPYTRHFASEAECQQVWMAVLRDDGTRLRTRLRAGAEMLGREREELVSEELWEQAKDLYWTDVPDVARALMEELAERTNTAHVPDALEADSPRYQRVASWRAGLITEIGTQLENDSRPLELCQGDLALMLVCLLLLKTEEAYASLPREGTERVDALVRSLPDEERPLIDDFLDEMAQGAEVYANRLMGLFDPADDTPASALIAQVIVRTPREQRALWEPLIPELLQCTSVSSDLLLRTWACSALRWLGPSVLDDLAPRFEANENDCREPLLSLLEEIPAQRSFELIRDHLPELTESYQDYPYRVLTSLCHPATVDLLEANPQPDEFRWTEAMVYACDVCGIEREDLPERRERYLEELAERADETDGPPGLGPDELRELEALDANGPVEMRLFCKACQSIRLYQTERVLFAVDPGKDSPEVYLTEDLTCSACSIAGQLRPFDDAGGELVRRMQTAFHEHAGEDLSELFRRIVPTEPYRLDGEEMTPLEGLAHWRERVEADETDPEARMGLAEILRELWRLDDAETEAERVLELKPEALRPRLVLAEVAEYRDDTDLAQERYRTLRDLARHSREPGWRDILRTCERHLEDRAVASEEVRRAREAGGVGRNDPCPCGSGKKYKKCCLRKA